ncbi:MAG TPA: hypothetical protein PK685_01730 [archaeon]|nr:hypothetical protein [archaeon]
MNLKKNKLNKKRKKDMRTKEKAISPIIAIILLVVICVVIVTIIINWGTNFTNTTLSSSKDIIAEKDDITGFIFVKKAINRSVLIQNTSTKDLVIKGYTIVDNQLQDAKYLTKRIALNPQIEINSGDLTIIPIACFPSSSFILNLYTIENKYIELKVNSQDFDFRYCESYNPEIVTTSCPDGYITVPGNPNYNTSEFCVQKYEARINDGYISDGMCEEGNEINGSMAVLENKISDPPETILNLCAVKKICENSGAHLITNDEWMTIARNIEQVSTNWDSGITGIGSLKKGNVGIDSSASYLKGLIDYGDNRNELAKLVLSNGEEIWDFSGNLAEWVDLTIIESCDGTCEDYPDLNNKGNDSGGVQHGSPGFEDLFERDWYEFTNLARSGSLTYSQIKPFNDYDSEQGVGKIYIAPGQANSGLAYNSNVHAIVRGGTHFDENASGVFAMNLRWAPSYKSDSIGFRCVIPLD